jgi:hypothetical protein
MVIFPSPICKHHASKQFLIEFLSFWEQFRTKKHTSREENVVIARKAWTESEHKVSDFVVLWQIFIETRHDSQIMTHLLSLLLQNPKIPGRTRVQVAQTRSEIGRGLNCQPIQSVCKRSAPWGTSVITKNGEYDFE